MVTPIHVPRGDTEGGLKTSHVHLLTGCRIQHDGDAPVSTFFIPRESKGNASEEKPGSSLEGKRAAVLEASFRGRFMKGIEQRIPQGYRGYSFVKNEEDSEVRVISSYDSFTYWKHHVVPDSKQDSFVRCMDWLSTARALHEDDETV